MGVFKRAGLPVVTTPGVTGLAIMGIAIVHDLWTWQTVPVTGDSNCSCTTLLDSLVTIRSRRHQNSQCILLVSLHNFIPSSRGRLNQTRASTPLAFTYQRLLQLDSSQHGKQFQ